MAKIQFVKDYPTFEVPSGQNLMQLLLQNSVPVASSCNGDGICGKCAIHILSGEQNLSSANDTELSLRQRLELEKHHRLSCQVHVFGDIIIDTKYW